ncbi:MAG: 4-alpha-glucanotransferase [Candidatus Omnitrophica bacterium]|nr:4-alpha-glucanotransferase [Candidatus Omnitrophota bacterium]
MKDRRGSGILLHVSSLSSEYGIGDVGPAAFHFVDFLKTAHQRYWQFLPFNPTDPAYGNSPYSSASAFACNDLFVSPEGLVVDGWLRKEDIVVPDQSLSTKVDYAHVKQFKLQILNLAYQSFKRRGKNFAEYHKFCAEHRDWLEDYATFCVLKDLLGGRCWIEWPMEIRQRNPSLLREIQMRYAPEMERIKFFQFIFFQQWEKLREYARQQGIQLVGDIPIYVNYDSADVWANPEIFQLDGELNLPFVAGVPPDYFSETGQRWGNPLYRWDRLKDLNYAWWIQRVRHNLKLFDVIRIDHFRGFVGYWKIPAYESTAIRGHWEAGPGNDFFEYILKVFPNLNLIAEDLGIITPDVVATMEHFHFPGMKIMQFAFGGDWKMHPYLPENYPQNCVAYTGTHDNNTTRGWFEKDIGPRELENLFQYFGRELTASEIVPAMMDSLWESAAKLVIVPMQDVLNLGAEARMNTPATTHGNWEWRMSPNALTFEMAAHLGSLTEKARRI